MMFRTQYAARLVAGLALATLALHAEEGKWTPAQVLQLDPVWLKQQGLELSVNKLWDPQRGTGLLAAAVNIGGCSSGFVSADGLILTNHHCLFGAVQEHSRPDRDLITNGYLARTRAEELPSKTTRVTVPRRFTDVTKEIEAAASTGADDLARAKAAEKRQKELVAECEKTAGSRCRVAVFDGGLQYVLIETFELTDIRLVYAPPRAVGEYGGETDNWMWPRHTGDFAMARAYKDGQPYHPEFYFPLAKKGVTPGDFVMVLGYPGRTMRSFTAAEMETQRDYGFRLRAEVFWQFIHAIDAATKGRADGTIAMAATLKGLNNVAKNAQGQLAGLKRGAIIEKQRKHEAEVEQWIATQPAYTQALAAKRELDKLSIARRATADRDFFLTTIGNASLALREATMLVRLAHERAKPDAERQQSYQQREWAQLRAGIDRAQKSYDETSDKALFEIWATHVLKLDASQRIAPVDAAFANKDVKTAVAALYANTKVTTLAERQHMFEESVEQLRARHDAMLDLAFALEPMLQEQLKTTRAYEGAVARLRPVYRRAVIAHAGKPVAPDANSTLRVTFAHVKGYSPRDGVVYLPQTTLAGMVEKHTGEGDFNLPEAVREAASKIDATRVPLDFLADADTTGGNSGSPTVNGRGELVGLNFDRVWENVANDFGYNPDVARNVNVDIRFFVWMLRDIEHANALLKELGQEESER